MRATSIASPGVEPSNLYDLVERIEQYGHDEQFSDGLPTIRQHCPSLRRIGKQCLKIGRFATMRIIQSAPDRETNRYCGLQNQTKLHRPGYTCDQISCDSCNRVLHTMISSKPTVTDLSPARCHTALDLCPPSEIRLCSKCGTSSSKRSQSIE